MRRTKKKMIRNWGERCDIYCSTCAGCVAWLMYLKTGKVPREARVLRVTGSNWDTNPDAEEISWEEALKK